MEGGPDRLRDIRSKGHPPKLSKDPLIALAGIVETGPDRAVHGVVRWRRIDLQKIVLERFGVDYRAHDRQTVEADRLLPYQRAAAPPGPGRARDRGVQKNFAETLRAHLAHLPKRRQIELWFQDEARIGQKNGLVRQWARRGTRPRQPADQRYESAYLFGAICPARGVGAALAMPFADTHAMQAHLGEIAATVAKGAHAILLLDRAGWHTTGKLVVPKNISLIFMPSRSPELNPVENVWQYLRANWLSNRVFDTYDDIIDAACDAWNRLIAQPKTITSIGMREWAHIGQN